MSKFKVTTRIIAPRDDLLDGPLPRIRVLHLSSIPMYSPFMDIPFSGTVVPNLPEILEKSTLDRDIQMIDDMMSETQSIYGRISEAIGKLVNAFRKDLYPIIHWSSEQIILELNNYFRVTRKLKKILRRIGFVKLRIHNRTIHITAVMTGTYDMYDALNYISNSDYNNICNGTFFPCVMRGEMVLMKYVNRLEQLKIDNTKWVEKFFK